LIPKIDVDSRLNYCARAFAASVTVIMRVCGSAGKEMKLNF
jgi:hypothetical protein